MLILTSSAIAVVIVAMLLWPRLVTELFAAVSKDVVWRATTSKPIIALTFDDGPDPIFTPQILKILADQHIRATFFLVGERARFHPAIVTAIRDAGHEIGNHTDSWDRTLTLSPEHFEEDLLRAEATLGLTNEPRKLFRPAGIWFRPSHISIAKRHAYTTVLGSAYAFDPYRPPTEFIAWEIARALHAGSIIVLHDSGGNRQHTVEALPKIIEAARSRGLEFVKLSHLLASDGILIPADPK